MSFVQAIYPLSLTDSEVPFTARAHYPRGLRALCSLARKGVEQVWWGKSLAGPV